jgi:hypothetical protein
LSQPTTLPSVIVKPHFGIVIAVISGLVICSALLPRWHGAVPRLALRRPASSRW